VSSFAFYQKVVVLNSNVHRNLKFDASKVNFNFVSDTTSVLLGAIEFAEAAREYPIVFIKSQDGKMHPVVLLGVRSGENLYVDESGKWDAHYIPAFVRRYPFVMAEGGTNGQLLVCIDENCPALNSGKGEVLIDEEGNLQPRMVEVMQFLQNFQSEFARTEVLAQQLDDLGLFVQQAARFDIANGETLQLNDFYRVDEVKLGQLSDDKLPALFRSGALGMMYLHLASMGNMRRLMERIKPSDKKPEIH
jgi:hypothetical protein